MKAVPFRIAGVSLVQTCRLFVSLTAMVLLSLPFQVVAQTPIISPSTLVLDNDQRGGIVLVGVADDEPAAFQVTDAFYVQDDDGNLKEIRIEDASFSAARFLRAGPRRFSLVPGEGMQLRIAARPPQDLAPGEYRLHLRIESLGEQMKSATPPSSDPALEVVVPIRVALAVRVLYRHKIKPAGGRIEKLAVQKSEASTELQFEIERLGHASLLAEYQVFARQADGKMNPIGKSKGANIYREIGRRHFSERFAREQVADTEVLCIRLTPRDPGDPNLKTHEVCGR